VSRRNDVLASAPSGSRFWLWSHRLTAAILAGAGLLLVADAVGLLESDPATNGVGILLGIAAFAWVLYWIGFVITVRLELTHDGRLRWFGVMRQGSIDVADIERISDDAAPLLWTIHHARGRLIVAFVTDMKNLIHALDGLRTDDPGNASHR